MKKQIFILGLVCFSFSMCASFMWHYLDYEIVLSEVERPTEAKERYGESKISSTEEQDYQYVFEDEMIKILWLIGESQFGFFMTNKTDHSIKIIWDEGAYVDENNGSHRIIHSGDKYAQIDDPQPPSVIVRKGTLSDIVVPSDAIYYSGGWQQRYLLPTAQMAGDPNLFLDENRKLIGKNIQVLLPIQIEDVTNDYIFIFKINDVNLRQ